MEKQTINLDELQDVTQKLLALLQDRQFGMMSWHMFLAERINQLREIVGGY